MKKKILFLHPHPPIDTRLFFLKHTNLGLNQGVGILAQIAIDRKHEVKVLAYSKLYELNKVLNDPFDWVFITTFTNQFPLVSKSLELIRKKAPRSKIVIGGVHASFAPEHFANYPYDYLVRGEGEIFTMKLLDDEDFASLSGVFSKSQKITQEFAPMVRDLDSIPAPNHYLTPKQSCYRIDIIGHRGCSFKCPYCIGEQQFQQMYDRHMRWRSPEKIIQEIEGELPKSRYSHIRFSDSNFFGNPEWLEEILYLYKKRVKLCFSANIRPAFVTKEILRKFKDAGCFVINMGIEHGNYQTRKSLLHRYETDEQIVDSFRLAKSMGLQTTAFNILGFPDDTEEDILKLIELNKKARPTYIHHTLFQPYPGTSLAAYAKMKKINYKFSNNYFILESNKKRNLPILPGIDKDRLGYYMTNFIKLAQKGRFKEKCKSFFGIS